MIRRGDIWDVDLPSAIGSEPAFRRPAVIVQNDAINASRLRSVTVVPMTTNQTHQGVFGVLLPKHRCGLDEDSIAFAPWVTTVDRSLLLRRVGTVPADLMTLIELALSDALGLIEL